MAINLSALQLRQLDLVQYLHEAINAANIPASSIELELTESILLQDTDGSMKKVSELKQLGVHLSIDDFGTGYSSLSYLKSLNVNKLKIDRSFVKDLPEDMDDRAIVRAIIHMAHDLGLTVVAEGVETSQQAELLTELGCDIFQGYYFCRPVKADKITSLMKKRIT